MNTIEMWQQALQPNEGDIINDVVCAKRAQKVQLACVYLPQLPQSHSIWQAAQQKSLPRYRHY